MNQDFLKRFPNQNTDNRGVECVGEVVAEIIGNLYSIPMDPGYNYAAALWCSRTAPSTGGSDPYAGMLGGLIYGCIPVANQDFDAKTTSELFEANIENYAADDRKLALNFTQNGVTTLSSYNDVVQFLSKNQGGVSLAIKFYDSFHTPNQDGSLPAPLGNYTLHNCAVYEATPLGLRAKMWLGPTYGDQGYVYISETVFNLIFISAFGFNPTGNRWWNLAYTGCTRPWLLGDILPQLKETYPMITPPLEPLKTPEEPSIPVSVPTPSNPDILLPWEEINGSANNRHNIRVIADWEGLDLTQKNLLSQVLHCESDWNPACVHPNVVNGKTYSTDYGICQWNDYYHGKEISPQDAVHDPEKAVRLMCQYIKAGQIGQWVCYSKSLYLHYTP